MTFNYQGSQALPQVPVIPSNSSAPVWAEAGDKSALNRVLIARSCNVPSGHGQHVLQTGGSHYFKNENCYPMLQSKLGGRIPSYRPSLPLERRITEHEYERQARRLYSRFLQKSGYQSYRNRQPKKGKKQGDTVWPDEMEHAFFRGEMFAQPASPGSRLTVQHLYGSHLWAGKRTSRLGESTKSKWAATRSLPILFTRSLASHAGENKYQVTFRCSRT